MTSNPETVADLVERVTNIAAFLELKGEAGAFLARSVATEHAADLRALLSTLTSLERDRLRGALRTIATGTAPPEPHGHYLAHRACVDVARKALKALTPEPKP